MKKIRLEKRDLKTVTARISKELYLLILHVAKQKGIPFTEASKLISQKLYEDLNSTMKRIEKVEKDDTRKIEKLLSKLI